MRLITGFELATTRDDGLHALLRQVFNAVASTPPNSLDHIKTSFEPTFLHCPYL